MVEVFKTNVVSNKKASLLLGILQIQFPQFRWNFDLEDCDNILRVEVGNAQIDVEQILDTVRKHSFQIEVLSEQPIGENQNPKKIGK